MTRRVLIRMASILMVSTATATTTMAIQESKLRNTIENRNACNESGRNLKPLLRPNKINNRMRNPKIILKRLMPRVKTKKMMGQQNLIGRSKSARCTSNKHF